MSSNGRRCPTSVLPYGLVHIFPVIRNIHIGVQSNQLVRAGRRIPPAAGLHILLLLHGGLEREVSWSELWSHGWNVRRWRPTRVGRKVRVRRVGPESSGSWEEAARKNKKGSAVDMTTVTLQNNVSINFKNDSGEPRVFNCLY